MIRIKTSVYFISYFIGIVGFLSVVKYVSPVYSAVFLALLGVGILNDRKEKQLLPRWVLNLVSLSVVSSLIIRTNLDNIVIPVVETLLILLGIKFLERKQFRDFMQIYTISVFLLAGSALLTIDISFMLFFITLFFSVVLAIILLTYYSQDEQLTVEKGVFRKIVLKSLVIPSLAIPFTVVFFVMLPRTQQPLLNFLPAAGKSATGFSDTVSIGDVSHIQESEKIAMRIKSSIPLDKEVYIRGIVLNFFDGKVWSRRIPSGEMEDITNPERRVVQEIILEPTGSNFLLGVDTPVQVFGVMSRKHGDFVFSTYKRLFSRVKYRVVSFVNGSIRAKNLNRKLYIQLPLKVDREVVNLARQLKGNNQRQTVLNVINYLKNNYRYSLADLPVSENPIRQFLFETRKGNCEYFASAAAVLLRLNNIPVRLVAGYKGVVYNQLGNYYIVPQKYAHTWIEVNIDGLWERYDPTGISTSQIFSEKEKGIWDRFHLFLDVIEYAYINSVINFDVKKQISMVKSAGGLFSSFKFTVHRIKEYLVYGLIGTAVFVVMFYLLKNLRFDREERLLVRFLKKLEKKGYRRKDNQGLEEFVNGIDDLILREKALRFVKLFESFYYRDKKIDDDTYTYLSRLVDDI